MSITERKEGGSSILTSLKIAGAMKEFGMREKPCAVATARSKEIWPHKFFRYVIRFAKEIIQRRWTHGRCPSVTICLGMLRPAAARLDLNGIYYRQ